MIEQERAAELADEIERKGLAFTGNELGDLVGSKDESVIVAALRAYAATPGVTDEMVEAGCAALVDEMSRQMGQAFAWPGVYRDYEQDRIRRQVRAALEAALEVKEPGQ